MTNRPADIRLPDGWTWERVEEQRAKWDIADNMVPIATAPGCVAWGTINSARREQASAQLPADAYWSCSFGYQGEERYSEYWRDAQGSRYVIAKDGHCWSFERIA